jgi:hypothetical protein
VEGKRFVDVSSQLGDDFLRIGYQRGAAVVDLNNDGFRDLVVTSLGRPPRILMNSGASGGNWLCLRVVGSQSPRDSIGATVRVTTPSGRQFHEHVTNSVGFLSSSDPRVHIGIGRETTAARAGVRWPGGATVTVEDVAANRFITVREPTSATAAGYRR